MIFISRFLFFILIKMRRYNLSISKDEYYLIKDMASKKVLVKKENRKARNCYIKMYELFFKKNISSIQFDERSELVVNERYYNFNVLYSIPDNVGDEVEIKTDDYGTYNYIYEDSKGNIQNHKVQLPLRNWKFVLKRISGRYTFCYLGKPGKSEYLVMKADLTD